MFCNTCHNLASRGMKPHELDLRSDYARDGATRFDCVWRSPVQSGGIGH
ncbi:MAG: hypothetical protein ABIK45_13720 [Pseudomonadota bacterium]